MAYKMKKVLLVTLALLCKLDLLLTANANIWDYSNLLFPYHPWFIPIVSFLYPDKTGLLIQVTCRTVSIGEYARNYSLVNNFVSLFRSRQ